METVENNEDVGMAAQVGLHKKNSTAKARGEKVEEALPKGASAVENSEEPATQAEPEGSTTEILASTTDSEPSSDNPTPPGAPAKEEDEEPIRLLGKTFKNQKEAFEYAEQVEREKLLAEAHAQGIRDALAAQQVSAAPVKEEEDDFETKFYSNPKETLREVQARARDEAVALIRAETAKEKAWNEFLSEYPDIRRQDAEAILSANAQTIGVLPWDQGRKALAQAVYKEYDEISNLRKPKTELTNKKPVLSPSGGAARGVTPQSREEKPLSFAAQLRTLRK